MALAVGSALIIAIISHRIYSRTSLDNNNLLARTFSQTVGVTLWTHHAVTNETPSHVSQTAEIVHNCKVWRQSLGIGQVLQHVVMSSDPWNGIWPTIIVAEVSGEKLWINNLAFDVAATSYACQLQVVEAYSVSHPPFLEQWRDIVEQSGWIALGGEPRRTLYFGELSIDIQRLGEIERYGFVNNISTESVVNDVTSIVWLSRHDPGLFARWYYTNFASPVLQAKVQLAESHGLLPRGFRQYLQLMHNAPDLRDSDGGLKRAKAFLEESDILLASHPGQPFEQEIRKARADWMLYAEVGPTRARSISMGDKEMTEGEVRALQVTIEELSQAVAAPYTRHGIRIAALSRIAELYDLIADGARASQTRALLEAIAEKYKMGDASFLPVIEAGQARAGSGGILESPTFLSVKPRYPYRGKTRCLEPSCGDLAIGFPRSEIYHALGRRELQHAAAFLWR